MDRKALSASTTADFIKIQLYKYTVHELFPCKSHHNQQKQTVCRHNTLHTANMANMLPLLHGQTPEFALGLLMIVTAVSSPASLSEDALNSNFKPSHTVELNRATSHTD